MAPHVVAAQHGKEQARPVPGPGRAARAVLLKCFAISRTSPNCTGSRISTLCALANAGLSGTPPSTLAVHVGGHVPGRDELHLLAVQPEHGHAVGVSGGVEGVEQHAPGRGLDVGAAVQADRELLDRLEQRARRRSAFAGASASSPSSATLRMNR